MIEISMRALETVIRGTEHETMTPVLEEIRRVFDALVDASGEGPTIEIRFVP